MFKTVTGTDLVAIAAGRAAPALKDGDRRLHPVDVHRWRAATPLPQSKSRRGQIHRHQRAEAHGAVLPDIADHRRGRTIPELHRDIVVPQAVRSDNLPPDVVAEIPAAKCARSSPIRPFRKHSSAAQYFKIYQ